MKYLFLVTSSVHTRHGVFTAEQRFDQTIKTFESIKSKVPNADILLIESSGKQSITEEEAEKMKPFITGLLNFYPDEQVQEIYKMAGSNWDVTKNMTELVVFGKALDFILRQQPQLLKDVDRVFKMSGRYVLNDNFTLENFTDPLLKDNYVFATRRASQFPLEVTGGLQFQLMSRLWSWPVQKTALVYFRYNVMMETFVGVNALGKYRDIEHLLLRYFDGPFLHEIPIIGVEGQLGPNGSLVKD